MFTSLWRKVDTFLNTWKCYFLLKSRRIKRRNRWHNLRHWTTQWTPVHCPSLSFLFQVKTLIFLYFNRGLAWPFTIHIRRFTSTGLKFRLGMIGLLYSSKLTLVIVLEGGLQCFIILYLTCIVHIWYIKTPSFVFFLKTLFSASHIFYTVLTQYSPTLCFPFHFTK